MKNTSRTEDTKQIKGGQRQKKESRWELRKNADRVRNRKCKQDKWRKMGEKRRK